MLKEDWVVVVTGGGTGIGLMAAQAFANNGARVYIASRRQTVLEQAVAVHGRSLAHPKGALIPLMVDVTSKSSIAQLVTEISKQEKHVDVLINSAGITSVKADVGNEGNDAIALSKALWEEDTGAWEDVYRTNVIGSFFTTVKFLPLLAAAAGINAVHHGTVINISSVAGVTHKLLQDFKYGVSKAAVVHMSTLLAEECCRRKVQVRVNTVIPGLFPSEMTTQSSDETNKSTIPIDDEFGDKFGIPACRPGRDEEIAQAVLALACNQYAYGSTLVADGGFLLHNP